MRMRIWSYIAIYFAGMATLLIPKMLSTHHVSAQPPRRWIFASADGDPCPQRSGCPPRPCTAGDYCVLVPTGVLAIPNTYNGGLDGGFLPGRGGFVFMYPDMKPAAEALASMSKLDATHLIDHGLTRFWLCEFPYTSLGPTWNCNNPAQTYEFNTTRLSEGYNIDAATKIISSYRSSVPIISKMHYQNGHFFEDDYVGGVNCDAKGCNVVFDVSCGPYSSYCEMQIEMHNPQVRFHGLIPPAASGQTAFLAQAEEVGHLLNVWYRPDPENTDLVEYLIERHQRSSSR